MEGSNHCDQCIVSFSETSVETAFRYRQTRTRRFHVRQDLPGKMDLLSSNPYHHNACKPFFRGFPSKRIPLTGRNLAPAPGTRVCTTHHRRNVF